MMAYCALFAAITVGLMHEFMGGWLSNDVLALSSVYVIVSRVQVRKGYCSVFGYIE